MAPANFWLKDGPFLLGRVPARYELLIFGSCIHDRLNPEKNRVFPENLVLHKVLWEENFSKRKPPNGWPQKSEFCCIEMIFVCPRQESGGDFWSTHDWLVIYVGGLRLIFNS